MQISDSKFGTRVTRPLARTSALVACVLWALLASLSPAADAEFFFRGGDRVVFLGDSITEQKLYTSYIEAYTVTGCAISNLKYDKTTLSFDRADECLPMPIDARAVACLKLAPVLDELSRYELQVNGLTADKYDVTIDGQAAGTVTKDELARGWNMTVADGPISKQGREVLDLIFKKGEVGGKLWSVLIRPRLAKQKPPLEKEVAELEAKIDAARQPKLHHFELKPGK